MHVTNNDFPVYRKFKGLNIWFKILDSRNFIELKQMGQRLLVHELKATQYPEIMLVQDMLTCLDDRWEPIEADIFETIYARYLND